MKNHIIKTAVIISFCCWFPLRGYAADLRAMANVIPKLQPFIERFTENTPDFSGVLQLREFDSNGAPRMQMAMGIAVKKGCMRFDVLLDSMVQIPEEHRQAMKRIGVGRIIVLAAEQKSYVMFPDLAAYEESLIDPSVYAQEQLKTARVSIQKQTVLTNEVIDGHTCLKTLVEVTEPNRPAEQAIISYASDLQDFPLQILCRTRNSIRLMHFRKVQLGTPHPFLFAPPTNYVRIPDGTDLDQFAKERSQVNAVRNQNRNQNGVPK
ncbi:MAG TPA: hypothetical protein VEH04_01695 [Verrucomicrobiae bacterium]|nr:hypothetical protein [Verrucomicrobiae bacterium]